MFPNRFPHMLRSNFEMKFSFVYFHQFGEHVSGSAICNNDIFYHTCDLSLYCVNRQMVERFVKEIFQLTTTIRISVNPNAAGWAVHSFWFSKTPIIFKRDNSCKANVLVWFIMLKFHKKFLLTMPIIAENSRSKQIVLNTKSINFLRN